jgi:hypothetical protein
VLLLAGRNVLGLKEATNFLLTKELWTPALSCDSSSGIWPLRSLSRPSPLAPSCTRRRRCVSANRRCSVHSAGEPVPGRPRPDNSGHVSLEQVRCQEALREVHIRRETIREDLHLRRPERHHLWGKLREAARKGVGAKTVISPLCGCVFSLEISIAYESHRFFFIFYFGRFYQSGFKSKRRRRLGWT